MSGYIDIALGDNSQAIEWTGFGLMCLGWVLTKAVWLSNELPTRRKLLLGLLSLFFLGSAVLDSALARGMFYVERPDFHLADKGRWYGVMGTQAVAAAFVSQAVFPSIYLMFISGGLAGISRFILASGCTYTWGDQGWVFGWSIAITGLLAFTWILFAIFEFEELHEGQTKMRAIIITCVASVLFIGYNCGYIMDGPWLDSYGVFQYDIYFFAFDVALAFGMAFAFWWDPLTTTLSYKVAKANVLEHVEHAKHANSSAAPYSQQVVDKEVGGAAPAAPAGKKVVIRKGDALYWPNANGEAGVRLTAEEIAKVSKKTGAPVNTPPADWQF
jgi:hypothetical protein